MVRKLAQLTRGAISGLAVVGFVACGQADETTTRVVGDGEGSTFDADGPPRSCVVEGVTLASGQKYGPCNSCTCTDGATSCLLLPCDEAAGAGGMAGAAP